MAKYHGSVDSLGPAIDQFLKVTATYRPCLFHCYDVPDLPRTNNELEHLFGATGFQERRATGRKVGSPTLVVRGSVRLVAAALSRTHSFIAADLQPRDRTHWQSLCAAIAERHTARHAQRRFRRATNAYLSSLEALLLKAVLPS